MLPLLAFNIVDPLAVAVMLFVLGCALLLAEVFFPSGGVLGFSSAVAMLAAIWYAFQSGGVTSAISFTLVELIAAPMVVYLAFQYLPRTAIGKKMLGEAPSAEDVEPDHSRYELIGRVGVARSKMLPSGSVEVDGRMIDAVTQGQPIEPGQYVKVVEVRGNRVMVRLAQDDERPGFENSKDLLGRSLEDFGIDDDPLS